MRNYPDGVGANWRDTSLRAADEIEDSAHTLRAKVLDLLKRRRELTTHEIAALLCRPVPSVQPRVSELAARGLIVDSGQRRRNQVSGKRAIAWQLASAQLTLL